MLFITTMVHMRQTPDIWSKTVYSVSWFNWSGNGALDDSDKISDPDTWSRYMDDIEASHKRLDLDEDSHKAPWALARPIRRGLDEPFKKQTLSSASSTPRTYNTSLPIAPLKVQPRSAAGSRFIEKFRESQVISRSESPTQFGLHFTGRVQPFPPRVDDHDLPIPLPRLSEWIRADAIKGINVHTVPHSP